VAAAITMQNDIHVTHVQLQCNELQQPCSLQQNKNIMPQEAVCPYQSEHQFNLYTHNQMVGSESGL
jgi:hypothetical protein